MTRGRYPGDPILVVDDEEAILLSIDTTLRLAGMNNILTCSDSCQVASLLKQREPSVMLLDLNMPRVDGESILDQVTANYPGIPVIVITGRIDADTAVSCMKRGAYDYIVKPVEENRLIASVKKSLQFCELRQENRNLTEKLREGNLKKPEAFAEIITNSPKMMLLFNYVESIATTSHPILIRGETGTGKELMARSIHRVSGRSGRFVATNVAGLDESVFSDTLFGHVKGAFTGADGDRAGLIEKAENGTLFLDEIGDLNSGSQIKLLRLLQEREYMPLGSDSNRKSTARIITSTHVDLWNLQQEDIFRKDLLFRLKTHSINLPPLRDRKEDLFPLLECFTATAAQSAGKEQPRIPPECIALLENYHFPGNIRELQAMVFDAVARNDSPILPLKSFREHLARGRDPQAAGRAIKTQEGLPVHFSDPLPTIKEITRMLIEEAMRRADNNQSIAATMLGISQQALSKRLRKKDDNPK